MIWYEYQWFVIIGAFLSFAMSWGIGANDMANSFATAIGAKTLTLFQACCIAAVMEFVGAISLGGEVSKTIAGSIANTSEFTREPEIFAYGMLCSLLSASIWVFLASYYSLAVSTTHSIIGSVIGFTLVWKGSNAVIWVKSTDEFPYVKGLVPIFISWITSPIMSSIISMFIFGINRSLILRRKDSRIAIYALPPLVFLTIFINMFFILYKGAKAELSWDANKAAWVSVTIASICSVLTGIICIPLLKRKVARSVLPIQENGFNVLHTLANITPIDVDNIPVGKVTSDDTENHCEKFFDETENVYKYLQVFSSCCVAFAHGANDVANAIGPFGAIWYVYNNRSINNSVETPRWMLVIGGAGIVIGLWTYGYNVIKALGGQLCSLTPSRGYSAELATALTVSFASVYGIPISTTHCIVGAEVGIGLLENIKTGVNWRLFAKTFSAWILTLIISGFLSALIFSQGIYSPSVIMSKDIEIYEDGIRSIINLKGGINISNDATNYVKYINDTCS